MHSDIVLPSNNEAEFIELAKTLGYSRLYLAYPFEKSNAFKEKITKKKEEYKKNEIKVEIGILADAEDTANAKKLSDLVIFRGSSREVIEKSGASVVFELEDIQQKDFLSWRNSGLNHVLAKLASEHNVAAGFSFSQLLNSPNRAQIMGRMSQNIRLCRKYKVKMMIASFASSPYEMRSPHDIAALFCLLGMHPKEAGDALKQ